MGGCVFLPPFTVEVLATARSVEDRVDWGLSAYGIPSLWSHTKGEGVLVAVIDSGIADHPDLEGAVKDSRNFSFDPDAHDTVGHGTHVAGIIAARKGMKGIAPECQLLAIKALGHSCMGSQSGIADAVRFASEAGADIICMSLGTPQPNPQMHAAIRDAYSRGAIVVCAAGNDGGSVWYPAAFPETFGVGAVDQDGKACEFSSRGKSISVAAPGHNITSTWLAGGYARLSGTSMAAPFVAGTLALYASAAKKSGSKIDHSSVAKALADTCRDVGETGRDSLYGWGLLDPAKLLNYSSKSPESGVTIWIPNGKVL